MNACPLRGKRFELRPVSRQHPDSVRDYHRNKAELMGKNADVPPEVFLPPRLDFGLPDDGLDWMNVPND